MGMSGFHLMVKPRGAVCNLLCDYCYFLAKEKLYPGSNFRMGEDVLEEYTRQYIQAQQFPEITFAWQGGEPTLMGLDFYNRAVELQQKYRKPGLIIHNNIQTNGTLLDDDWGAFFAENNFLVGISIDGPSYLHDVYRHDKGGGASHAKVITGLDFLKKHHVEYNLLTTVNSGNSDYPLDVYHYLRDELNARFIQFIPIVERDNETGFQKGDKVTSRSVSGIQWGQFLIAVFDEWIRNDVGKVFVQIFDVSLGAWLGQPGGLCIFAPVCGLGLAMEHNGDIYSCDHYVEPDYYLGNILENELEDLVTSEKQIKFGLAKHDQLPRECLDCAVRFACNGGCPKNRLLKTRSGDRLNYLCAGYKAFFHHVDEPMKIMAGLLRMQKPASGVMDILAKNRTSYQAKKKTTKRRKRRRKPRDG
jgi:uncharacterized protein